MRRFRYRTNSDDLRCPLLFVDFLLDQLWWESKDYPSGLSVTGFAVLLACLRSGLLAAGVQKGEVLQASNQLVQVCEKLLLGAVKNCSAPRQTVACAGGWFRESVALMVDRLLSDLKPKPLTVLRPPASTYDLAELVAAVEALV